MKLQKWEHLKGNKTPQLCNNNIFCHERYSFIMVILILLISNLPIFFFFSLLKKVRAVICKSKSPKGPSIKECIRGKSKNSWTPLKPWKLNMYQYFENRNLLFACSFSILQAKNDYYFVIKYTLRYTFGCTLSQKSVSLKIPGPLQFKTGW